MVTLALKILSVVIIFIIIFSVDYLFLRDLFWQRLIFNIGIVLVYFLIYSKYLNE